jgi:hypothetical protein
MNPHDLLTLRSRALHRAVAEKIRARPELVQAARDNLDRWIGQQQQQGPVSKGLLRWKQILDSQPVEEVLRLLCDESPESDRLRHATPFAGILTEAERAAILGDYATTPT